MHIAFVCVVPRSVRHGGCPSCGGCAGRSRGAGRAGPARQRPERSCSHSAHLGKKVKDETTTHRGRTRSNEPIIEGSRYKKVEARRYKVKPPNAGEHHPAPDIGSWHPTRRRNGALRHSAHGRPQPSVITIRYPSRSYVTRYSTRGSPVAHAGRCSDALLLYSSVLRARRVVAVCSDRARSHRHTITLVWWSGRCFPVFLFVCCTCGCVCHRDHEYEDLRV